MARSLVCIAWTIPICLPTHIWHVGGYNLTKNNIFGVVQHVLHPQQCYLAVSMFVALSNRLRPSTIYLLLGSRSLPSQSFQVTQSVITTSTQVSQACGWPLLSPSSLASPQRLRKSIGLFPSATRNASSMRRDSTCVISSFSHSQNPSLI